MILRVRQCCCALPTFVKLVSVFFLVFHSLLALSAAVWYLLFSAYSQNFSAEERSRNGEVNDDVFDSFLDDGKISVTNDFVAVVVLASLAAVGLVVNVLIMVGIKANKRAFFLPWLVFHFFATIGCFAAGVYVALWFTVLRDNEAKSEEKVLSVLALFPIVGGIFLIFLWILVDQLYLQMGRDNERRKTSLKDVSKGQVNANYVTNVTSLYATLPRMINDDIEKLRKSATPSSAKRGRGPSSGTPRFDEKTKKNSRAKSMSSSQQLIPYRQDLAKDHPKKRTRKDFEDRVDFLGSHGTRTRSLEHIVDPSGSSSTSSTNTLGPNYWVADGARLIRRKQPTLSKSRTSSLETGSTTVPSYCTVDRRLVKTNPRALKPQARLNAMTSSDESVDNSNLAELQSSSEYRRVYRVNGAPPRPNRGRSRSVELLLSDEQRLNSETVASADRSNDLSQIIVEYDGITSFNEPDDEHGSTESSTVELDLKMLPLNAANLRGQVVRRLRRADKFTSDTLRSGHSVKSVTIAPDVTEFHYSEDECANNSRVMADNDLADEWLPNPVYPPPPPPLNDKLSDSGSIGRLPTPPPPPPPPIMESLGNSREKMAKKQFFYSVSDVRL